MRRVLFDTNVILDVLLEREPHYTASALALDSVGRGAVEGLVTAHAVTTLANLLAKRVGQTQGRQILSTVVSKMRVAAVTDAVIRRALASNMGDFEDAVCNQAAAEAGADVIVTRNIADFAHGTTLAVLPEALRLDS